MDGSKGADYLQGGKGADVFQISKGLDIVKDFNMIQGDQIALDKSDNYTIIDESDGVLIVANSKKKLLLEGVIYEDIILAGTDIFVQPT